MAGLEKLAREFDFIREVRGEGLIIGLDLSVEGAPFVEAALKRGLVINCTHEHILRFLPPFVVRAAQVKQFLAKLKIVFAKTPRPKAVEVTENLQSHLGCGESSAGNGRDSDTAASRSSTRSKVGEESDGNRDRTRRFRYRTDLLTGMEWNAPQVRELLHLAADVKARPDRYRGALAGRFLALIFEKPSLRTRVTFEVGIASLGGSATFLDHTLLASRRARIGSRCGAQPRTLDARNRRAAFPSSRCSMNWRRIARIPVINALTDRYHPCQAFADFFTLEEHFGGLRGLKVAYVGDGNNVCHSLLSVGARLGAHVRVASPAGYEPDAAVVTDARRAARDTRGKIELFESPSEAVAGAQVIYTDVWTSMGQEAEIGETSRDIRRLSGERRNVLAGRA